MDDAEMKALLDRWDAVDKALGLKHITMSCEDIDTVEATEVNLHVKHVRVEAYDMKFDVKRAQNVTLKDVLQELDKQPGIEHYDHRFFEGYRARVIRNGKRAVEIYLGS